MSVESRQYYLSTDLAPRLAAIDIGTNSIRLIIAEALRDGTYRILDDEKEPTRLGRNLSTTGRLDPDAVELSLSALRRMTKIAAGYQVSQLRAIATCAVREAEDGPEFCRRANEETGLDIETISARKEAHLALLGVQRAYDLAGKNVVVVDIGGGSTEIVLASGRMVESIHTTPLGAVRISELYGGADALTSAQFDHLSRGVGKLLRKHTQKPLFVPQFMIGSGGTFTSLATMLLAKRGQGDLPVQGLEVNRADLRHLLDQLRKMSSKQRRAVAGLSTDRADIIVGGLVIVDRIMRRFHINRLQVHTGGVRDGLLLSMVDQSLGLYQTSGHDRDAELRRFAAGCGVDLRHAEHVAELAGNIFDGLSEHVPLRESDRTLLQAAALLQDVGYLINYAQHHKHSYHLILNSGLSGFQPWELELIAIVARYHRGAIPKMKHETFRRLSNKDRKRVRQLAAMLRLAGGLDRSHGQLVHRVTIERHGSSLEMLAHAEHLPEVDIWGARRRSDSFRKAFHMPLMIGWLSPSGRRAANEKAATEKAASENAATGKATSASSEGAPESTADQHADKQAENHTGKHADKRSDKHPEAHSNKQTDKHSEKQSDKQAEKLPDKQSEKSSGKQAVKASKATEPASSPAVESASKGDKNGKSSDSPAAVRAMHDKADS